MFLEGITNPDYQSTVELCQAHKYDLHECTMQVRAKDRRLEREEVVQRGTKTSVRRSYHHEDSQDKDEKHDRSDKTSINIKQYKTEFGYYSIPSEIWSNLVDSQNTKIKQFNSNLRKRRRASEHRTDDETTISPLRTVHIGTSLDSVINQSNELQKIVIFEGKERDQEKELQEVEEDTQEIINRRGILRFNMNPKETNN